MSNPYPPYHQQPDFGTTANAHQGLMAAIWGPGINVSIFIVQYSYRRYPFLIHAFCGLFACLFSLSTSIPIVAKTGIISSDSIYALEYYGSNLRSHYIVGITCVSIIFLETILGIIVKGLNLAGKNSSTILFTRKIHQIFGYIVAVACKANIYVISPNSVGLYLQDIAFVILIIIWKIKFPRVQQKINPSVKNETEIPSITSLAKLPDNTDYCIFTNFVYDLVTVKAVHPAGYQIIDSVKNRQIDRFVYGMYSSQTLPQIPKHSHSIKFYALLGTPVAKINIPVTYQGFDSGLIDVQIENLQLISEQGCIYLMNLKKIKGDPLIYKGYQSLQQLGRFYSITHKGIITRLYTSVNFLTRDNRIFMEKIFNLSNYSKNIKIGQNKIAELTNYSKQKSMIEDQSQHYCLPILFKMYHSGKFTSSLIEECKISSPTLILSESKGQGLQISHLPQGKIILIAGGTGIYPYSDLIDLLYKQTLVKIQPSLKIQIGQLSPVIITNCFDKFSFHLMGAFRYLYDIHPITLEQILYLVQNRPNFKFTLKISQKDLPFSTDKIRLHGGSFVKPLQKQLEQKQKISKIYVCGPPKMNEQLSVLLAKSVKKDQYLIM